MSAFTHEERKFFYKELLKMVCKDPDTHHGFCWYVLNLSMKLGGKYKRKWFYFTFTVDLIEKEYPELYSIKPIKIHRLSLWFNASPAGWETRINKLHNIIQRM